MESVTKADATLSRRGDEKRYAVGVKIWLVAGLFMIFVQIVVGGITRLTGSGLSITRWEIVTGTIPPVNEAQWEEAFDLYKATPQYEKINQGMSMSEFKFIYFWEYFHRLWARLMGFVFIIPFGLFYFRGMLDKPLLRRLVVVFLLAAAAASFGWIMVASGLVERPWVNAYKLAMHLSLALILYSYLLWTSLQVIQPSPGVIHSKVLKKWGIVLLSVVAVQIILGGIMSGMKASLFYPTWPDMNGKFVPPILFDTTQWNVENFVNYDRNLLMPALVQVLHRFTAYFLIIISLWYFLKCMKTVDFPIFRVGLYLLITVLITQVVLGILTLINSIGLIPVGLGAMHQAGAVLLLTVVVFLNYQLRGAPD